MLAEGDVIYSTDRKVPGTGIELEFTLQFLNFQFVATLTTIHNERSIPFRRNFEHLRKDRVLNWLVGLVGLINEAYGLNYQGILRNELEHLMDTKQAGAGEASPLPALPIRPPALPVEVSVPAPPSVPEHFMLDDCWSEEDPTKMPPRQDITTFLTIRRTGKKFLVHLKVFMGPEPSVWDDNANAAASQQTHVARELEMVAAWLCAFSTTQVITSKFGLDNSEAVNLATHWHKVFTPALMEAKKQLLPSWLIGKKPPTQQYIIDDQIVQLP